MVELARPQFVLPQWIAGFSATMLMMQVGFMGGWPSPNLARLTAPDSPLPLTLDQASWVAALANVGRFFGAIVGAMCADMIGTKRAIFVTLWPLVIGWFLNVVADSVELLYTSRISLGLGLGMTFSCFPLYLGEVAMPEIRGALISLTTVGGAFGTVVANLCGSYLSFTTAPSIYFGLAVALLFVFFWLPESPHHLIKVGDRKAAEKSVRWYRDGKDVDKELEAVERFVSSNTGQSFWDKLQEFKTRPVRKAAFHVFALYSFMQICGLNSLVFYMETILKNAKFTLLNPADMVIYVNTCGIFAAMVALALIDRCGRRFLLIISSSGVCISMLGLSIHFTFVHMGCDVTDLQPLPMVSMFLFVIAFFLGLMCVPSTILSETFPANIKCIGACIGSLTGAVMAFLSTKTYQPLVDTIGETYLFLIYATCSSLVIPYTIFLLRETKGKTLAEIQEELKE